MFPRTVCEPSGSSAVRSRTVTLLIGARVISYVGRQREAFSRYSGIAKITIRFQSLVS